MDKSSYIHRVVKCCGIYSHVLLLQMLSPTVLAGEIAGTPLTAYPAGGHNFLILHGTERSMGNDLSDHDHDHDHDHTSYSSLVSEATSALFTDTSTVVAKATIAGQSVGIGLMTYGGTSNNSPYLWPLTQSPYTSYPDEIGVYCRATVDGVTTDWGNMFYVNSAANSHPYCLPKTIPRPVSYLQANGTCSSGTVTNRLCYQGNDNRAVPSSPALGKLQIPIEATPRPTETAATTRATAFANAIRTAQEQGRDSDQKNAIEGSLLTACDYFNSKWLDSDGAQKSYCYRGYQPGPVSPAPANQFSNTLEGYSGSIPNTPLACTSSIIFTVDSYQNLVTADGTTPSNPYSSVLTSYSGPDFDTSETNPGTVDDPGSYTGPSDPVFVALNNLYRGNKGPGGGIRTFMIGLGLTGSPACNRTCQRSGFDVSRISLDKLAVYGFSSTNAKAYYPAGLDNLKNSLDSIFSDVLFTPLATANSSNSSAASNSTSLQTDNLVFIGQLSFGFGWFGDLKAYQLDTTNLTLGTLKWSAKDKLTAAAGFSAANRSVYTYNPVSSQGIAFQWNDQNPPFSSAQQALLGNSNLVNWLRGDITWEGGTSALFRNRRGALLGDIVNSNPVYSGTEDFDYSGLSEGAANSPHPYQAFLSQKATHMPMVYVGANDGMLHGFTVGTSPGYTDGGTEAFAYIPNAVIGPKLVKYSDLPGGGTYYPHVYTVDGSPVVGDAFVNDAWRTVLVGTTGAGAKAVFALDVTCATSTGTGTDCASGFSASKVMWEISDSDTSACTPVCGNTTSNTLTSIHGDLGYTLPDPSIVRLNNGQWAAIVANGYNSDNGHAVLFIFNLANGSLIRKLDTGSAGNSVVSKNGLSTPIAVDIDGNRTADYVYAGDLKGNVWKFNITCPATGTCDPASAWSVVSNPIFVACTTTGTCTDANRQPITGKPSVGIPSAEGQSSGVMVYAGTGKYFELGDNVVPASPQTQSFYAIWDEATGTTLGRSSLVAQTIDSQSASIRTSSSNNVNYANSKGWYMDLFSPDIGSLGERVTESPILRNGHVLFETLIPNPSGGDCTAGGGGWAMELDAMMGTPVRNPGWAGGVASASGFASTIGILAAPAVIRQADGSEIRVYTASGKNGQSSKIIRESGGAGNLKGRISWTQVQ